MVKKTDLFVPPDVDAIIHSTNRVMGNGRVEKLMRANLRDQGQLYESQGQMSNIISTPDIAGKNG